MQPPGSERHRQESHAASDVVASSGSAPVDDPLLASFIDERPALVGLAYRITGSRVDAEDIVQEAWLRARGTDPATIERPAAWLTTVVARLGLDHLRSARHRRERYVGPWLPEPVASAAPVDGDPAGAAELAESVTFGFLRILDTLGPTERVVFLLADVFDVPFTEIAVIVDRSPEACRQVASRARRRVRAGDVRHDVPREATQVIGEFLAAVGAGDVDRVIDLLADDAVLVSDGGPEVYAARRPVVGAERIARFTINLSRRVVHKGVRLEKATLNGEPGLVALAGDRPVLSLGLHVVDGRVAAMYIVVNPDKLAGLDLDSPMV
jgi:RNA polymerase sigma-70 factor (ECF subfamily)